MTLRSFSLATRRICLAIGAGTVLLQTSQGASGDEGVVPVRFVRQEPVNVPPDQSLPPGADPQAASPIQLPLPRLEIDVRPSAGVMPEDVGLNYVRSQGIVDGDVGPRWYLSPYSWEAPNLFHHPLYFEDAALERHGRSRCAFLQPGISAVRAAGQFAALPVQMVVRRPLDCVYSLGYGKPRVPPVYPYPWCSPLCHNPYANYPRHLEELPAPVAETMAE